MLCIALAATAAARGQAQTRAGTPIVNTAGLRYESGGAARTLESNTVTLLVAERLDVRLEREGEGPVARDAGPAALPFILTNADNGGESFAVVAALSDGGAPPVLAIDRDGDGRYDPARDAALADGTTPVLAPGETLRLFALVAAGSDAASDSLVVSARATTGSGAAGRSFDGQGDGGGDAVVGRTGAAASVTVPLRTAGADPVLIKTQAVTDGARRGSVITYTLEARFPGAARAAVIADPIPDGTMFVPGSLRVDDAALTDGADADAGSFDGRGIVVALGDVAAAATHIVRFQAKIQ